MVGNKLSFSDGATTADNFDTDAPGAEAGDRHDRNSQISQADKRKFFADKKKNAFGTGKFTYNEGRETFSNADAEGKKNLTADEIINNIMNRSHQINVKNTEVLGMASFNDTEFELKSRAIAEAQNVKMKEAMGKIARKSAPGQRVAAARAKNQVLHFAIKSAS